MRARDAVRFVADGVQPAGLREIRAARTFGRQQRLSGRFAARLIGHRRAARYGLHLLPPGIGLDGLVIDVGANQGDFAAVVRQLEPRSRIVCIEPVAANAARLRKRFADDRDVEVHELAASDRAGMSTFNVTAATEFASLHAPTAAVSAFGANARVVERVEVATQTLDALVHGDVRLLKIDVQGHELSALRGATRTLERATAVLIEVLFVSQYEGDTTFAGIDEQMRSAGFDLIAIEAPAAPPNPLMWGDACYVRRA